MSDEHPEIVLNGERNLVTERQGGYRSKVAAQGYVGLDNQVHHVLPCGSSSKSKAEFLEKFAKDNPDVEAGLAQQLLEQTSHWNVNDTPNLIGLPTRTVYALKFGTPFAIAPPTPIPLNPSVICNLPIHLWNHVAYSTKAKSMADAVWAEANLKIEDHKNGKVKGTASDIQTALQGVSNRLRARLVAPTRKRTKEAWRSGDREAFQIFPFL